jgi:hypothetical protein
MKYLLSAVAIALLAVGTTFKVDAQEAEGTALSACPPATSLLTPDCADQVCAAVSSATDLATAEQAVLGRNAATLIRDYGESDSASSAKIVACVSAGPTAVFASYSGSEVAKVGEDVPASEQ